MTRSDSSAPRPEASSPVLPFHRVARVSLTPFNPAGESSRVRCQAQAPELSSKSDGLPIVSDCVAPSRLAGVRLLTASAGMVTLPGAPGCEFHARVIQYRQSVGWGKSVSVLVNFGGRRIFITKKKKI